MEKKNISFETRGNSITMRYELSPSDELDSTALDRLDENIVEMTAPIKYSEDGDKRVIYSLIPSAVQLSSFLKQTLSKGAVLTILKNLITGMDIGKHSIPVSYIVKDINYIYIDDKTLETYAYVIPIKNQSMDISEIPEFFRSVLSHMKYRDEDKDNYVAKLITNVNSDRFSLADFNVMVNELMLDVADMPQVAMGQAGIKVDKAGVLRNRATSVPRPPMGQPMPGQMPPMGQPMPGQMPPMGQPMPGQMPPMGQPMPGQMPPMGQPRQGQVPPMGQPRQRAQP